ncbi:MAG: vWA domain-containing protein [Nitrososphaerales archaeon]
MMKTDLLVELATFLIKAWSGRNVIVQMKDAQPRVILEKNAIVVPTLDRYYGDEFDRYRQWRVHCWLSAMRLRYSTKFLSDDLAYGHVLNAMEQKRVERLGVVEWPGMIGELVFDEAMSWQYRPVVNSLYGLTRRVIAFSQYFLTGYIKGDLDGFEFSRIERAAKMADEAVDEAVQKGHGTSWVDQFVPKILKELDADPLLSVPLPSKRAKMGVKIQNEELISIIEKMLRAKAKRIEEYDHSVRDILEGRKIREEFESIRRLSKITEKHEKVSMARFPVEVPTSPDTETLLYDTDLVNKLQRLLKDWKSGWVERQSSTGEEFDVEGYLQGRDKAFVKEVDLRVKSKLAIMLDHSSSIESGEVNYKRTFIALCKVLDYLGVRFVALAFNTVKGSVKCWVIKSSEERWTKISERRVQNVKASGGTPLAEVYVKISELIKSFKPDIFLTLSDGEPNDPSATKEAVSELRRMGIKMVSFGIGEDTSRALGITRNLKKLGYDRCVAISRVNDIPKKVLEVLARA